VLTVREAVYLKFVWKMRSKRLETVRECVLADKGECAVNESLHMVLTLYCKSSSSTPLPKSGRIMVMAIVRKAKPKCIGYVTLNFADFLTSPAIAHPFRVDKCVDKYATVTLSIQGNQMSHQLYQSIDLASECSEMSLGVIDEDVPQDSDLIE
jgi:hypothetical protein